MQKEIDERAIHEFNKLYYKINGLYVRFENTKGFNSSLYKVLHALYISDLRTQKDIMQNYEMPKQTINNVIVHLQKQDFVEILASQNDKRERVLNLTKMGVEYAKAFIADYTAFERKVYQKLGVRKFGKLIAIYADFEKAFNEILNEEFSNRKDKQ